MHTLRDTRKPSCLKDREECFPKTEEVGTRQRWVTQMGSTVRRRRHSWKGPARKARAEGSRKTRNARSSERDIAPAGCQHGLVRFQPLRTTHDPGDPPLPWALRASGPAPLSPSLPLRAHGLADATEGAPGASAERPLGGRTH